MAELHNGYSFAGDARLWAFAGTGCHHLSWSMRNEDRMGIYSFQTGTFAEETYDCISDQLGDNCGHTHSAVFPRQTEGVFDQQPKDIGRYYDEESKNCYVPYTDFWRISIYGRVIDTVSGFIYPGVL